MTGEEILKMVRYLLDDKEEEYLWEDIELCDYLNQAIVDFCKQTRLLFDSSTVSTCQIKLLANLGIYSLAQTVLSVESGQLASATIPLTLTSRFFLDQTVISWQTRTGTPLCLVPMAEMLLTSKVQFVPKYYTNGVGEFIGASNVSFTALTRTISTVAPATFTGQFATGDEINVSGTVSNDGYYTVATVTATTIVVNETLVNEANKSAIIRKVEDTANLTVTRLPITEFTITNLDTLEPEIPFFYHRKLYDGIMAYAYLKQDADTYDPKASERFMARFMMSIREAKKDVGHRRDTKHIMSPHPGTI